MAVFGDLKRPSWNRVHIFPAPPKPLKISGLFCFVTVFGSRWCREHSNYPGNGTTFHLRIVVLPGIELSRIID